MKKIKFRGNEIKGHLDIKVYEVGNEITKRKEVSIHGDPEGLKSLAKLLIKIASLNQENDTSLPVGAREHYHLRPNIELSKNSEQVTVGRLDANASGEFYDNYVAKDL